MGVPGQVYRHAVQDGRKRNSTFMHVVVFSACFFVVVVFWQHLLFSFNVACTNRCFCLNPVGSLSSLLASGQRYSGIVRQI